MKLINSRWSRLVLWALVPIVGLTLAAYARSSLSPDSDSTYQGKALDDPAAGFQLTDQAGKTVSLADFRGKIVVLTFMESQCKEICPLTAAQLRIPSWHFLTGTPQTLEAAWKSYDILVQPATAGQDLVHSSGVYLIDQNGRKRWYISTPLEAVGAIQWIPALCDLLIKHIHELVN